MQPSEIPVDLAKFPSFVRKVGNGIQEKSVNHSAEILHMLTENHKVLVSMMDIAYQDAFNSEMGKKNDTPSGAV